MDRSTNRTDLISLVAITGVLTIALHQLGNIQELSVDWADPLQWAAAAAPEELIGSVARYTGLALGYWVLTTTTLYFAWGVRNMRPPRLVTLLTIPAVRRIVDRTLAATLAATVVLGPVRPALAEAPPPPPPIVFETADDGIPVPHIRMGQPEETSAPITEPEEQPVASTPSPPTQQPVVPAPSAVAMTATHTVAGGENLWVISKNHLAATGAQPDDAAVADYWRRLIAANASTLRSGDPNLIFAGEVLTLPGATP